MRYILREQGLVSKEHFERDDGYVVITIKKTEVLPRSFFVFIV